MVPATTNPQTNGTGSHDVEVDIRYVKNPEDGTPITIAGIQGDHDKVRDVRKLLVKDVRPNVANFSLEKNGFQYVHHEVPQDHFSDEAAIKDQHYPVMEAFMTKLLGAKEVIAFNHIVRNAPWETVASEVNNYRGPAHRCHIDMSNITAKEAVDTHLKRFGKEDMIPSVLAGKWQLLNIWRPLKTIQKHPLAVADSSTVPYSDQYLLSYDRVFMFDGEERKIKVETPFTMASKDDRHRFYYIHEQRPDELLIFKTGDSDPDTVGAVTHTSFELPGTEHLPTRESIEMRLLVIY